MSEMPSANWRNDPENRVTKPDFKDKENELELEENNPEVIPDQEFINKFWDAMDKTTDIDGLAEVLTNYTDPKDGINIIDEKGEVTIASADELITKIKNGEVTGNPAIDEHLTSNIHSKTTEQVKSETELTTPSGENLNEEKWRDLMLDFNQKESDLENEVRATEIEYLKEFLNDPELEKSRNPVRRFGALFSKKQEEQEELIGTEKDYENARRKIIELNLALKEKAEKSGLNEKYLEKVAGDKWNGKDAIERFFWKEEEADETAKLEVIKDVIRSLKKDERQIVRDILAGKNVLENLKKEDLLEDGIDPKKDLKDRFILVELVEFLKNKVTDLGGMINKKKKEVLELQNKKKK